MIRTQIYLDEQASKAIRALALESGKKQSEIIREAIASYLSKHRHKDKKSKLRQACGIWKGRDDLPDIEKIRHELDERIS
ncbi:MAG TPA: CopG family transcriptional regulator [Gammaproteobacteria bacterium]|nr:CopG family transcriptional regulator [Gammaproteobacteria bacterium]